MMISASLCLSKMASVFCSGAVVVQVVLAAKTALPYLAVHTAREHERQPRAREHGRLRRLLRRVGDPRSSTRIH